LKEKNTEKEKQEEALNFQKDNIFAREFFSLVFSVFILFTTSKKFQKISLTTAKQSYLNIFLIVDYSGSLI